MQHQSKIYESIIIINATLEDAQIETEIEKVKDFITKNNGEIRSLEKWGRRRLAYAIKKKNNGFYVLYEFKAQGDLIAKLERHYLLNENVIRFLTIELNKKALKAREVGQKTPITMSEPPQDEAAKEAAAKEAAAKEAAAKEAAAKEAAAKEAAAKEAAAKGVTA